MKLKKVLFTLLSLVVFFTGIIANVYIYDALSETENSILVGLLIDSYILTLFTTVVSLFAFFAAISSFNVTSFLLNKP